MKLNKKQIVIILSIVILTIIISLLFFNKGTVKSNNSINLNQVTTVKEKDDEMTNFLYERYNPEDNLKFSIVGSNTKDTYALYYNKNKVTFKDFPDIYKQYIIIDTMNYQTDDYDESRKCYKYNLEEYKDGYKKNFGTLDDFKVDTSSNNPLRLYLDDNDICIQDNIELSNNYDKSVDTYIIESENKDKYIYIREKVAFIKLTDSAIEFYNDYKMENKIYTLDRNKVDLSFINNSKVVSNVVIEYQDKLPTYEYKYIKGERTYYLESITRK